MKKATKHDEKRKELPIQLYSTYRKYKESTSMSLVHYQVSQPRLDISDVK
jgi:hypothetical protein